MEGTWLCYLLIENQEIFLVIWQGCELVPVCHWADHPIFYFFYSVFVSE